MAQLFRHLFENQTLKRRVKAPADSDILKLILHYCKKLDPKNQLILFRLPKSELHQIAAIPCPTTDTEVI
jgi:hypothetical protein